MGPGVSFYQKFFGVGPIGILISLAVLGLLWLLDRRLGRVGVLIQPGPVLIFGLIMMGICVCWVLWCFNTIRRWWLQNRLCTTGPYRFVRHPIYAGWIWLGCPGVALVLNSWIMLIGPFLLYFFYSILVRKEEKMMEEVFGDEYRQYASRTGRLFPRIMK
jgi:protein-S-isoprenylcysteine O-methyltransferase Ste14